MKDWPKDGSTVDFEELVKPLRSAIRKGYRLTRIKADKDIPWTGYRLGMMESACCIQPDDALTAEGVAWALEHGRDLMDTVLELAIQLGIEQGRRQGAQQHAARWEMARDLVEHALRLMPKPTGAKA